MLSLDSVFLIKYRSGKLNKSPSGSGRTHFTDEVQVQFAGGPPPFFPRRDLRPEYFVQGVYLFCQLSRRQRSREFQHGFRSVFQGVTELALQVLLHALGVKEQLNLVNNVPDLHGSPYHKLSRNLRPLAFVFPEFPPTEMGAANASGDDNGYFASRFACRPDGDLNVLAQGREKVH